MTDIPAANCWFHYVLPTAVHSHDGAWLVNQGSVDCLCQVRHGGVVVQGSACVLAARFQVKVSRECKHGNYQMASRVDREAGREWSRDLIAPTVRWFKTGARSRVNHRPDICMLYFPAGTACRPAGRCWPDAARETLPTGLWEMAIESSEPEHDRCPFTVSLACGPRLLFPVLRGGCPGWPGPGGRVNGHATW